MKSVVRCLRPIPHIRDWAFAILLFGLAFDRALPEIRAFAQSDDATSRAVPIDSSFTYQGRIDQDGVPANGAVLMQFNLWDAASGGAAVATVPSSAVAVANGLFAVQLNFGSAHFTGDRRWIETIANGISLGRVELTATPYAAFAQKTGPHSHFGDQWTGSSSLPGVRVDNAGLGPAVFGNNTGNSTGVDGQSVGGIGVFGKTQSGLAGVYAETSMAEGTALFARSFGTAGIAVSGIADVPGGSNDGVGVVGSSGGAPHLSGSATGVSGSAYGSLSVGVYGYAIGSAAEGIHAKAEGAFSVGIQTSGESYGLIAEGEVGVYASGEAAAVRALSVSGRGAELRSTQDYALYATTSNGFAAVWGRANINPNDGVGGTAQNGVYGQSYSTLGSGLFGRNESSGAGVTGFSVSGLAGNFLGPITVGSCSGCAAPSDARLKEDIQATAYGLEAVKALKPVSFSFFDERYGLGTHLGFLAQDVQGIVPELVSENADGYLRVEYDGLIPVLVNAIQELQAEVDSLRTEVLALQAK